MPDANGWPTEDEVLAKLVLMAPDGLVQAVTGDLPDLIPAIIAEFQSPVGPRNDGGTGRTFTLVTETRYFDGNGYPELRVDDLQPNTALGVTCAGGALSGVILKTARTGMGWNILALQSSLGLGYGFGGQNVFPLGHQNIAVAGTWGYGVPKDVWEAIRCEVCFRALSQGAVDLAGIGETVKIGDFEINTSAGVSVWEKSSPLAICHRTWLECINRYRDDGSWRRARIARRMS